MFTYDDDYRDILYEGLCTDDIYIYIYIYIYSHPQTVSLYQNSSKWLHK